VCLFINFIQPNAKCRIIILKAKLHVINVDLKICVCVNIYIHKYIYIYIYVMKYMYRKCCWKIKVLVRYVIWTEINLPDCFTWFLFSFTLFQSKNIKTLTENWKRYFYRKGRIDYLFQYALCFLFHFSIKCRVKFELRLDMLRENAICQYWWAGY